MFGTWEDTKTRGTAAGGDSEVATTGYASSSYVANSGRSAGLFRTLAVHSILENDGVGTVGYVRRLRSLVAECCSASTG
jgi:hypothetical protein